MHPLQEQLKEEAKAQGLWNLWLPADMAVALQPLVQEASAGPAEMGLLLGPGLTNLGAGCKAGSWSCLDEARGPCMCSTAL